MSRKATGSLCVCVCVRACVCVFVCGISKKGVAKGVRHLDQGCV